MYPPGANAGRPAIAGDGTMSFVVRGLVRNRTYYFALSAYTAEGAESALSDERALGTTDPCVVDRCYSPSGCEFGTMPDGASCGTGQACEVCATGACRFASESALTTRTFRVGARRGIARLTARSSFPVADTIELGAVGISLEINDAAGAALFRAFVPPEALKSYASGTGVRLFDRDGVVAASGLRRLQVRVRRGVASASVLVTAPELALAIGQPQLTLVLRIGAQVCAVDPDLTCNGEVGATVTSCR